MKGQKAKRILLDNRGSALMAVFLIITVMMVLGMGILALSVNNIKQAKVDNTYERDYYVADGGAQQGVEAVKSAVLQQYNTIAAQVKIAGSQDIGANQASSFFSGVQTILSGFAPTQPDSSSGGPTTNTVTISPSIVNSTTYKYTILSISTDGKTPRNMLGSINITFVPVVATVNNTFKPLGTQTVITGGTLVTNGNYTEINGVNPGAVRFGTLPTYTQYQLKLNGTANPDLTPYVDTTTASNLSWSLKYPAFTSAVKVPDAQLTLPAFSSATSITNSAFSGAPYNWTVPSPINLDLEGSSGTYTMSSFDYIGGQIYCTANLSLACPHVTGTASNNVIIYCHGDLTLNGAILDYVKIYCDGNVTINGGGGLNHVTLYSNGTITDSSNSKQNIRFYCKTYTMSGGGSSGDNIIYAENSMHLEDTISGMYYCNGNITIGGGAGVTGQIAAKGNITLNGSFNFNYDAAMIARLNVDPFTTTSTGSSSLIISQPVSSAIYSTPTFNEQ